MTGPPRVLVVDDEQNIRFVAAGALRLAGFEVDEAGDGREALRKAAGPGRVPDIVVLDVMLPELDGFEVCRRMRSDGLDVPVLFLTARDATEERVKGLTIGGDDYLTKPFSVEELVARVRVILRRFGKSGRPNLASAGEISLDDDSHVVTRAGAELSLSPTEYKLLRYLMANSGRALSRAQILDHVWNYDFEGESTVVETFVSSLRKKLDGAGPSIIQTVRGYGYRLKAPAGR